MADRRYFTDHFPHRYTVLTTFRERFGNSRNRFALEPEVIRDLHRCSKDAALIMVRSFCEVFGWTVPGKNVVTMRYGTPSTTACYTVVGPSEPDARADSSFGSI